MINMDLLCTWYFTNTIIGVTITNITILRITKFGKIPCQINLIQGTQNVHYSTFVYRLTCTVRAKHTACFVYTYLLPIALNVCLKVRSLDQVGFRSNNKMSVCLCLCV